MRAGRPQGAVGGGVLDGTDDRMLDAETHGRGLAAAAPGIALELIEGVGHMLPITQPERCAAFIEGVAKGMPLHNSVLVLPDNTLMLCCPQVVHV